MIRYEIKAVEVTRKEGKITDEAYSYNALLYLKAHDLSFFRKIISTKDKIIKIKMERNNVFPDEILETKEEVFIDMNSDKIRCLILAQCQKVVSEDECCTKPDIVPAHTFRTEDILLGHLLNNEAYEVVDYKFKGNKAFIKFKLIPTGKVYFWSNYYIYHYELLDENKGSDVTFSQNRWIGWTDTRRFFHTVKESACLNCKTCLHTQEDSVIADFEKTIKEEIRHHEALRICSEC